MEIAIASDHAGYIVKDMIASFLADTLKLGDMVLNLGCNSSESVDYPDYSRKVCSEIMEGKCQYGILVCGTGIGMSMAANKIWAIRAALCKDVESAIMTRKHNNANVLCLGARNTDPNIITDIVDAFLNTEFEGGRHEARIKKFSAYNIEMNYDFPIENKFLV